MIGRQSAGLGHLRFAAHQNRAGAANVRITNLTAGGGRGGLGAGGRGRGQVSGGVKDSSPPRRRHWRNTEQQATSAPAMQTPHITKVYR